MLRRLKPLRECCVQGDHHGCPYKTWSAQQLSAQLASLHLSSGQVAETVAKAKAGHYQLACALAFEGVHQCSCDSGINHPNQASPGQETVCHDSNHISFPSTDSLPPSSGVR